MRVAYDVSVDGAMLGRVCLCPHADFQCAELERGVTDAYTLLWGERHQRGGVAERLLFELPAASRVVYGGGVLSAVGAPGRGEVARVHNIDVTRSSA